MKMSKQEIKNVFKRSDPKNPSLLISYWTRVSAFELYFDPSVENNLVYATLDSLLEVSQSNFSSTFIHDSMLFKTLFLPEEAAWSLASKHDLFKNWFITLRQWINILNYELWYLKSKFFQAFILQIFWIGKGQVYLGQWIQKLIDLWFID